MKRFLAVCAMCALFVLPQPSFAHEEERTLSVSGTAFIDAAPDAAAMTVAVETTARSARESAAGNARLSEGVMDALRSSIGPSDTVETAAYSVFPVYEYEKVRGETLKGFRTVNQVRVVTSRTSAVGAMLDAAIEAGAMRVVEVRFFLKDATAACDGLIRAAAQNAASQARAASNAFGEGLGSVKSIVPRCALDGPARPFAIEAMRSSAATTPIEPGTVRLRAEVDAVYYLYDEE